MDPMSGNLDRIQIVKGWLGTTARRTSASTTSPGRGERRKRGRDGKVPPVGNTVDVRPRPGRNTIGDPELSRLADPDFDPAQRAFYYARVLEIPTPRWTTYDAVRFGLKIRPTFR